MTTASLLTDYYWSPIQPLLAREDLSDIRIIRFDRIWVRDRTGLQQTDCAWANEAAFQNALMHLARAMGHGLDASCPILDAMLPDGSRVNAAIPPRSSDAHATIRVLRTQHISLDQLNGRMIAPPMMLVLRAAIAARLNILISGETSSGKTTLLRALLRECGANEAMFVIEDTAELRIELPCAIYHETPFNPASATDPSIDSIYSALRSAPDRVVLGEIRRSSQLSAYLRVLATGFRGCMATIHASPGEGVLARGEEMLMEALSFSDPAGYRRLLMNHVDLLLHCSARHHASERRLSHIHWVNHADRSLSELMRLERSRVVSHGPSIDAFMHYVDAFSY